MLTYFQRNRFIRLTMNRRHHITEATLAQKVAIFINVLELYSLSVTTNYFK